MKDDCEDPNLELWVSPALVELSVEQTAFRPGVGPDGGFYEDCTLS